MLLARPNLGIDLTERSLMTLSGLVNLTSLVLSDTNLTEPSLEQLLKQLFNLQQLEVARNNVITGSTFTRLQEKNLSRPNLKYSKGDRTQQPR